MRCRLVKAGILGLVYDFMPYSGDDMIRHYTFQSNQENLDLGVKVVFALCISLNKPSLSVLTSLGILHILRRDYGKLAIGSIESSVLKFVL